MKTQLTAEESAKLIELGVSPERASNMWVKSSRRSYTCEKNNLLLDTLAWRKENVSNSENYGFIFTLADILDILPKKITFGHRTNCRLKMQPIISSKDCISEVWQACYLHTSLKANAEAPELIDALYSLLLWVINHNHVKLD